jgi:hypothetical protein
MITARENTMSSPPANVKVIPGHGPISTPDDIRTFIKMLKDTSAVVEKGVEQGKTLEQLQQEMVLKPWQRFHGDFITTDLWIETLYNEVNCNRPPAGAVRHN